MDSRCDHSDLPSRQRIRRTDPQDRGAGVPPGQDSGNEYRRTILEQGVGMLSDS